MDGNSSTGTDLAVPQRVMAGLPVFSGEAYQHLGKYAGAIVASCFEQIGGLGRMAVWADQNPTDFYTKLFPKLIQRSTSVDVSGNITIDDAIARLESSGNAIDAEYEELAPQYDL